MNAENDPNLPFVHDLTPVRLRTLQQESARTAGLDVFFQDSLSDGHTGPELAIIPAGVFTLGNPEAERGFGELAPRNVDIERAFAIGRYCVTADEFQRYAEACGHIWPDHLVRTEARQPVTNVSRADATGYLAWLSELSGQHYRLPTEAEWEYAARGGTSSRYSWGDEMRRGSANCKDCGEPWQADGPSPVASFPPNAYGLHDMNGSVWEWVEDCWHSTYKNAPADARAWTESFCPVRVIRGGSWRDGASYMPTTTRFKYDGSVRHSQNGFRVARDVK